MAEADGYDAPKFPTGHRETSAASVFLASSMHAEAEEPRMRRYLRIFDAYWRYSMIRYHRYKNAVHVAAVAVVIVAVLACFIPTFYRSGPAYTKEEVRRMTEGGAVAHLVSEVLEKVRLPQSGVRQFLTPEDIEYNDRIFDQCTPLLMNEITSGAIAVQDGGTTDGYDHLVVELDDMRARNELLIAEHFGPPNGETVALMPKLWDVDLGVAAGIDFNPCFMTVRMPNGVFLSMINPSIGNTFESDPLYRIKDTVPVIPSERDIFPFWKRTVDLYRVVKLYFVQWPGGKQRVLDIGTPIDDLRRTEMSYGIQLWYELMDASDSLHAVVLFQEEEEPEPEPEQDDHLIVKDFTADEWALYVAGDAEEEEEEIAAVHPEPVDDLDYLFMDR